MGYLLVVLIVIALAYMLRALWLEGRPTGDRAYPTACRHQRVQVMDGEVDQCWSCGQAMPR